MWIGNRWHESHTDLSQYFIERLKQVVDYKELISNQHFTTNGFVLTNEMANLEPLVKANPRYINRLGSLLKEAKSIKLGSSVVNDYILNKFHPDIQRFFAELNNERLKKEEFRNGFFLQINIFKLRLESNYYSNILFEINQLDFESSQFDRLSLRIDGIIDSLVPYLLYIGYSPTSISDVAYRFITKEDGITSASRIINVFNSYERNYSFLIKSKCDSVEFSAISEFLTESNVVFRSIDVAEINALNPHVNISCEEDECLVEIEYSTIDPHNFLRTIYDQSLKRFILRKSQLSLQFFNNFFESAYWKFAGGDHHYQKSDIELDPINIKSRKNTLYYTLEKIDYQSPTPIIENENIPIIPEVQDAVYFYNLAIGSKSIENSLLLLWTALECLNPFKHKSSDIENIQEFLKYSLSIGSIGRELFAFVNRMVITNNMHNNCFVDLEPACNFIRLKSDSIRYWLDWLCKDHQGSNDPYEIIKSKSNLLARKFVDLNEIFTGVHKKHKTAKYWTQKIEASMAALEYQIDRIYLHRNQIVHAGKVMSEYTNLWNHLEWYLGKLLGYCYWAYSLSENKNKPLEIIFYELRADHELFVNLLRNHESKKISEIKFSYDLALKHVWQFI